MIPEINVGQPNPACISSISPVKNTFLDNTFKYAAISIDLTTYSWDGCASAQYVRKIASFMEVKQSNAPILYNLSLTIYYHTSVAQCHPNASPLLYPEPFKIQVPSHLNATIVWDFSNDPIAIDPLSFDCLGFKIQCIMANGNLCTDLKFSTCSR